MLLRFRRQVEWTERQTALQEERDQLKQDLHASSVRQAKETRPEVKVVFMSGYTEGAFGASGPEIPNAAFLPKPFSLTQLTEAVFQQLN